MNTVPMNEPSFLGSSQADHASVIIIIIINAIVSNSRYCCRLFLNLLLSWFWHWLNWWTVWLWQRGRRWDT